MPTSPEKRSEWVGYLRVSTPEQAERDLSLPAQRRAVEEYAARNGRTLSRVYVEEQRGLVRVKRSDVLLLKHVVCQRRGGYRHLREPVLGTDDLGRVLVVPDEAIRLHVVAVVAAGHGIELLEERDHGMNAAHANGPVVDEAGEQALLLEVSMHEGGEGPLDVRHHSCTADLEADEGAHGRPELGD